MREKGLSVFIPNEQFNCVKITQRQTRMVPFIFTSVDGYSTNINLIHFYAHCLQKSRREKYICLLIKSITDMSCNQYLFQSTKQ